MVAANVEASRETLRVESVAGVLLGSATFAFEVGPVLPREEVNLPLVSGNVDIGFLLTSVEVFGHVLSSFVRQKRLAPGAR